MQAIYIGMAAVAAYSLVLLIGGLIKLFKEDEKKLAIIVIVFMVVAPLLILATELIPEQNLSIWLAMPSFVLIVVWVCAGYFLESYRKRKAKDISMGIFKKEKAPPQLFRRNIIILIIGLIIWLCGANGLLAGHRFESIALAISLFLITAGIASLWRYRGF